MNQGNGPMVKPDTHESRIARLEKQVSELREELTMFQRQDFAALRDRATNLETMTGVRNPLEAAQGVMGAGQR